MAARSYDREVRFERAGTVHDGFQQVADAWGLVAKVPARMKPGIGSERFANEQNAAEAPAVFDVLFDPRLADLSPSDRLVDLATGRTYDIKSVRWDGRLNAEMEILASARSTPAAADA
jgi:hypothetical protein